MGILTDGKRWLLRWPNAGPVRTTLPYAFTLEEPDRWLALHEWLQDSALVSLEGVSPDSRGNHSALRPGQPLLPARHRRPQDPLPGKRRTGDHPGKAAVVV